MNGALDEALLLKANPDRLFFQQKLPLPDGIAQLIRIAINPDGVTLEPEQRQLLGDEDLQAAAAAYLKGVCLFPGSQGVRVLGLNDAADPALLVEHRRLLLKWLHPDRNPENRHLAERVNRAWGQIKLGLAEPVKSPLPAGFGIEPVLAPSRRRSRFPLFLAGLTALTAGFWLWSLRPDPTDYVGNTESASVENPISTMDAEVELAAATENAGSGFAPEVAVVPWGGESPDSGKPADLSTAPASIPERDASAVPQPVAKAAPAITLPKPAVKTETPANVAAAQQSKQKSALPEAPASQITSQTKPMAAVDKGEPQPAVTVPPGTPAPVLSPTDAKAALQRFVQLYRAGEIEPFMAQFSSDARNNQGGLQAIREDYTRLFRLSKRRELAFNDGRWQVAAGSMRFQADYRSKVGYDGQVLAERNSGRIEIEFRMEGGQVRIAHILVLA